MCAQHCLQSSPPPRPSVPDGAYGVQCISVVVEDEVPRSWGWLEPPGWDRAEPGVLRLWVHRRQAGTCKHEEGGVNQPDPSPGTAPHAASSHLTVPLHRKTCLTV